MARLLATPRHIKHVVRRVERVWHNLAGEVDVNDLIVVTALREGAPEIFDFLVENIDAARNKPDEFDKRPDAVKQEWEELLKSNEQARLSKPLIDAIGIRQLSRTTSSRKQTVQDDEPNDYFRRILNEEVDPNDLRDQTVLADIAAWLGGDSSTMLDRLFEADERHEEYLDIWEYFGLEIPNERLTNVIEALVHRLIATRSDRVHLPALTACWRQNNRRHDKSILGPERLLSVIQQAMPVNLPLVNDLYYFWTSTQYGPYENEDRKRVRQGLAATARETYSDPRLLIDSVRLFEGEEYGWAVRQLIEPADQEGPPSDLRELTDWRWLAGPLIAAAELAPDRMLPQLARLVGDVRTIHRMRPVGLAQEYQLQVPRGQALFEDRVERVLRVLSDSENAPDWIVQEAARQSRTLLEM